MDHLPPTDAVECKTLLELVARRSEALARVICEPRKPKPYRFVDRWLLASLLQKAIRRGDLDVARRAGHQLLYCDPVRLWRRLMVVGLEDIGIGDPEVASLLVALASLSDARAIIGLPVNVLDAALGLACGAVKERSGDCFGSISKELEQQSHSLDDLPIPAKMAVLSYGHLPWRRRLRAAFLLGRDWAPAQERKAQFIELMPLFQGAEVPECLLSACLHYRGKADDLLPLYVPLAYMLWLATGSSRTIRSIPCGSDLVGEVPAYGFDPLHTRLGRRAVDIWLKSYLSAPPFSASQVAIALWNVESAASNRILDWPLAEEITSHGHSADLLHRGLAASHHQEIAAWISEQSAILQQAQRAVWDVACSAARDLEHETRLERKGNDEHG